MLQKCGPADFNEIHTIINDAASAYKGVIPDDCWHEPYMSIEELKNQIKDGVEFWCLKKNSVIQGVMGVQDKKDVILIRHAYVRTAFRNKGIGGKLLTHLLQQTHKPVLIGTWGDAIWAIEFYRKHGFRLLSQDEGNLLLKKYWTIPQRQLQTSVVLANIDWIAPL